VLVCQALVSGPATACSGGYARFFDGSALGLGSNEVDAISVP
jgi:hypothetical protein